MTKQISRKGQRLFALLLAVAMMFSVMPMSAFAVTSTNVNEDGYIEVYTVEDLYSVRYDLTANYILMNDIDLTIATAKGGDWDFMGNGWNPIGSDDVYGNGAFEGIFDGNGNTITGMRIDLKFRSVPSGTTDVYLGLFANVAGTVKNLTLTEGSISYNELNQFRIGTVAGTLSGTIENCHTDIDIDIKSLSDRTTFYVGGISGLASETAIVNKSSNEGDISFAHSQGNGSGKSYISGIVGFGNVATNISQCYNNGNITLVGSVSTVYLSGVSHTANISDSYNSGILDATATTNTHGEYTYGIGGTATRCYNIGNAIGGASNYAIASETSTNCFYLDGVGSNNTGSTPLTRGQLKLSNLYTGFDFDNVWVMDTEAVYL